jgi:acetyl-CoA carboxylase carboxyltransferase component
VTTTTAEKLAELREKLDVAKEPAGEQAIAKRAKKGIPSARDRIDMLLDPGSFIEVGALMRQPGDPNALYSDGVVTGHGTVDGRPVAVFSHDQTVFGGSVGEMFGRKVAAIMEFAAKIGCPCVGINDSGGARVQDAVTSLAWYAELGRRQEPLSGMCPQISMILGKCAGGAVYAPINTDILVATEESYMFVTGPDVVRKITGEDVSLEELGGARNQAQYGNLHHVAADEKAAFEWVRKYLSFLPSSCMEQPPVVNPGLEPEITDSDRDLDTFIPDADNAGYDMHDILLRIFAVDTPGFLPGLEQERIGVIKRGGRFIFAFVTATVPKVTVVIRKAYGGAYAVMGSKQLGADINFAWPTARIAVMGAEGAVDLIGRRQIEAAGENAPAVRRQLINFYNENIATPYIAAERGYIDAVIEPSTTRLEIRKALTMLRDKTVQRNPRKHDLMPL